MLKDAVSLQQVRRTDEVLGSMRSELVLLFANDGVLPNVLAR